jgi:hypothetical protein
MVEMRNLYKVLARKPKGKRPPRRPKHRWEYDIRMYVREVGWEDLDWLHLTQVRDQWRVLVNTVINLWAP